MGRTKCHISKYEAQAPVTSDEEHKAYLMTVFKWIR
jgi:hypothetical protein